MSKLSTLRPALLAVALAPLFLAVAATPAIAHHPHSACEDGNPAWPYSQYLPETAGFEVGVSESPRY